MPAGVILNGEKMLKIVVAVALASCCLHVIGELIIFMLKIVIARQDIRNANSNIIAATDSYIYRPNRFKQIKFQFTPYTGILCDARPLRAWTLTYGCHTDIAAAL